jgi:hypothetical protein
VEVGGLLLEGFPRPPGEVHPGSTDSRSNNVSDPTPAIPPTLLVLLNHYGNERVYTDEEVEAGPDAVPTGPTRWRSTSPTDTK